MIRIRRSFGAAVAVLALALTACAGAPSDTLTANDTDDLAANRAQMIAWLNEYRLAGEFPVNLSSTAQPIFIDHEGRLCAVAYLMMRSGYSDVVTRIAATNNNALVADLAGGPLARWIRVSGLTVDQIVNIQEPAYMGIEPLRDDPVALVAAVDEDRTRIQGRLVQVADRLLANSTVSMQIVVQQFEEGANATKKKSPEGPHSVSAARPQQTSTR